MIRERILRFLKVQNMLLLYTDKAKKTSKVWPAHSKVNSQICVVWQANDIFKLIYVRLFLQFNERY